MNWGTTLRYTQKHKIRVSFIYYRKITFVLCEERKPSKKLTRVHSRVIRSGNVDFPYCHEDLRIITIKTLYLRSNY